MTIFDFKANDNINGKMGFCRWRKENGREKGAARKEGRKEETRKEVLKKIKVQ